MYISSADWWQKNATASYGITKADTKDLASVAGLEAAGTSIVSITLTAGVAGLRLSTMPVAPKTFYCKALLI